MEDGKNMIQKNTFFSEFKWAVHTAFKDSIANCLFESGDILYDTQKGYLDWQEAIKHIKNSIQINFPPRGQNNFQGETDNSKFIKNWNSKVELTYYEWSNGDILNKELIKTTQGKLLTFLQKDDFNIFDKSVPDPTPLLLAKEILNSKDVQNFIKNKQFLSFIGNDVEEKNLNFFLLPFDPVDNLFLEKYKNIKNSLQKEIEIQILDIPLNLIKNLDFNKFIPTAYLKCFCIESKSPEKFRDIIKQCLWPKRNVNNMKKKIQAVFEKEKNSSANSFKLINHGYFIPYRELNHNIIYVHSFNHTPITRYRLHTEKIEKISKGLSNFLNNVIKDCPNHIFHEKNLRISKLDFNVSCKLDHTNKHELISLALQSRDFQKFKSRHENLEQFLLENDEKTIAAELPLWLESSEFIDYFEHFNTRKSITGHIDILRTENNKKIGVWDYKPNAYKEKKAHIQVFFYAFLLSVRSGIKLSDFICGYFDELDLFSFSPEEVRFEF